MTSFALAGHRYRDKPVYTLSSDLGAVEWGCDYEVWHYPQEAFPEHSACYPCELIGGRCYESRADLPARHREVYARGDTALIEHTMRGDLSVIVAAVHTAREQRSQG